MHKKHTLSLLLLAGSLSVNAAQDQGLKNTFADSFKMGVAVNQDIVTGKNAAAQSIIAKQFNTVTLENAMKAEVIYPQQGKVDFSGADAFIDFAKQNNMFTVAHTLVWHNQTPDWFFTNSKNEPNTPAEQLEQMRKHIELVAGRYKNKVDAWDVVNEVIADDGSYRPTVWVNRVGDGDTMVKAAFKYAQQYSPNTELYYNDFNAWRPEKRDGIIRMIKMLQKEGIRIDGIGIQAHWGLNFPKMQYIEQAIDAYAALGIKVMITELDIDVLPLTKEGQITGTDMMKPQFQLEEFETYLDPYKNGLPSDVEAQLNARYKALFELFYAKRDKIDRVTFWGLHDGMSWKNDYPIPNRTNYPLLWDRNLNPKPIIKTIADVVQ
ncbi:MULTISPECIES: endo-1,4-beta-xylanase [unclassified Pseudoalteromonas]|uniref:endo-1,4-beta-xylanase n=1 Tax=unclassified Pseudoalteromonas TaxID=194690 RepID=UPI0018CEB3B5|nr:MULTISPECIES: endo-1,4-beta-xylanase [unclassified Pseudoalteromonas]MBH0012017.1 endo-1,4-beta-xylanase [Pseudoalteromonas sp. NZS100_1]MBH0037194.1 endo-1,4-beta-xylanase [Pseudoalteromonas sp. SWN166]MBH0048740.1 endo-1,4-beta-xylanase [Pseudoalteromonas sp. SWYJZ19]